MKKTSIFKWRTGEYTAALILSDRHQPKEREVAIEVPKAWVEPIRVSPRVVRRPGGLTQEK